LDRQIKEKSFKRKEKCVCAFLFLFFVEDLDLLITDGHAVRSSPLNYVDAKRSCFHLFLLFGAAVSLLPASRLGTEAWLTGEWISVCLLAHSLHCFRSRISFGLITKVMCQTLQHVIRASLHYNRSLQFCFKRTQFVIR